MTLGKLSFFSPFCMAVILATAFGLVIAGAQPTLAQTQVTTCNQHWEGDGVLAADLDCTSIGPSGIGLIMAEIPLKRARSSLDLQGFTFTVGTDWGILCIGRCKIFNGTIRASDEVGIVADGTVFVDNVTFSDHVGSVLTGGRARVSNSIFTGNGIVNSGSSQGGKNLVIRDSTLTGNFVGIGAWQKMKIIDSTVTGNLRSGIDTTGGLAFTNLKRTKIKVVDSIVTGNGTDPECGTTLACADLISNTLPRLRRSTCDTSHVIGSGLPGNSWGICALD